MLNLRRHRVVQLEPVIFPLPLAILRLLPLVITDEGIQYVDDFWCEVLQSCGGGDVAWMFFIFLAAFDSILEELVKTSELS